MIIAIIVIVALITAALAVKLPSRLKNYVVTIRNNQDQLNKELKGLKSEVTRLGNSNNQLLKVSKDQAKEIAELNKSVKPYAAMKQKQNVYAVGSGRCGSKSLAAYLDGHHEPAPNIIFEAYEADQGRVSEDLLKKIEKRKELAGNVLSDNRQSFVIPQIKEADPLSKIIVLMREPVACINSFYARGAYSEDEKSQSDMLGYIKYRIKPGDEFPEGMSDYMKCAWYYLYTYKTIFSTISGEYELLLTENIPGDVKNKSKKDQKARLAKYKPTKEEKAYVEKHVIPYYKHIISSGIKQTEF